MNNLSILLYVADVASNIASALVGITVVAALISGLTLAITASIKSSSYSENADWKRMDAIQKAIIKKLWLLPTMILLSCLLPSKTTVYMIAASQAGAEFTTTPEFNKIRNVLNKYLDDTLTEKKNDD